MPSTNQNRYKHISFDNYNQIAFCILSKLGFDRNSTYTKCKVFFFFFYCKAILHNF